MTRHRVSPVWWVLLLALFCAAPAATFAQDPKPPEGFEKMRVGDETTAERLPAAPLVYTAYAAVWIVLLVYLFILWRRASRVDAALRDLQTRLRR